MEVGLLDLVLAAIGGALSLALAAVVLVSAPRRRANRLLAFLLVLSGVGTFTWAAPVPWPALLVALALFNAGMTPVILVAYVHLLAETLDTPLVAWLRRRGALAAGSALLLLTLLPVLGPARDLLRQTPPLDVGPVYAAVAPALAVSLAVLLWAFAASVSAWRRAPVGSPTRTRAFHFALAFGVRDGCVVLALAANLLALPGPWAVLWPLALVLSVPLLAYGILKSQVLDIDLRLKAGVRRGTVAGAFLVVFALVAVAVERATTQAVGLAAGGVGVALLLLGLVPLQRFAGRVADRLFPGVTADASYLARRRLEVYRAALEDALARDGARGASDPVLADLRRALGVSAPQHEALLVALRPRGAAAEPYTVVRELGRGGSGRALLARDALLGRFVVLKTPLLSGAADREAVLREASLAARIQHPNVVAVHHVLADRDPPVLVLEHVDGESLAERLARQGPLDAAEAARVALDVLAGLERIHAAGIVHRDLKPANVLLARDGTAKITDFGVAHAAARPDAPAARAGSPAYMSPEQARGLPLDARSDLYSLALVLHEALTGRLPAPAGATLGPGALPVPPAALPAPLAAVLDRALETDPARRFPDAASMAAALRAAARVAA